MNPSQSKLFSIALVSGALVMPSANVDGGEAPAPAPKPEPGRTLFVERGCVKCHAVEADGVKSTRGADSDKKPVDLSGVGARHEEIDLKDYVMKKKPHVAHDGQDATSLHKTAVKDEGDAAALAAYLRTLTKPAETKK